MVPEQEGALSSALPPPTPRASQHGLQYELGVAGGGGGHGSLAAASAPGSAKLQQAPHLRGAPPRLPAVVLGILPPVGHQPAFKKPTDPQTNSLPPQPCELPQTSQGSCL